MQDPHDENFEEGELGVEKPVYGPTLTLISKIYGETRTVVVSNLILHFLNKLRTKLTLKRRYDLEPLRCVFRRISI